MTEQEQTENIINLKAEQKSMSEKIDDLKKEVVKGFDNIDKKFDKFIEEADKKYASKPTEYIAYGFVAIVLSAFIGGLVYLVWK